jgi:hypothetical protein
VNTSEQFDAGDRDVGKCEVFKAEHGPSSTLDAAMILSNQAVVWCPEIYVKVFG